MLLVLWLFLRTSVWPRLEHDWLNDGYTRQNGLSGKIPPGSCPPPWEVSLTRRIFHPLTAMVGAGGGAALLLWRRSGHTAEAGDKWG